MIRYSYFALLVLAHKQHMLTSCYSKSLCKFRPNIVHDCMQPYDGLRGFQESIAHVGGIQLPVEVLPLISIKAL